MVLWLPLGAGERTGCVRTNGRLFEAVAARWAGRTPCALYHSALLVDDGADRWAVEVAPAWGQGSGDHGAVRTGDVGLPGFGRSRWFRYEVRRWRGGAVPDAAFAVDSPQAVPTDVARTRLLLDLVPEFPTATWGRDELGAGEMWNSNSLVSWLLVRSGHDVGRVHLPAGGRAPGWDAGLVVAARDAAGVGLDLRRTALTR